MEEVINLVNKFKVEKLYLTMIYLINLNKI